MAAQNATKIAALLAETLEADRGYLEVDITSGV